MTVINQTGYFELWTVTSELSKYLVGFKHHPPVTANTSDLFEVGSVKVLLLKVIILHFFRTKFCSGATLGKF